MFDGSVDAEEGEQQQHSGTVLRANTSRNSNNDFDFALANPNDNGENSLFFFSFRINLCVYGRV